MIIVTGAGGFIASNLIAALNKLGRRDILAVGELTDGRQFKNLVDCHILDYWDKDELLEHITHKRPFESPVQAIFHQGACSNTTEWDGRYMMNNNYAYSKALLHACLEQNIPFIYASSAAIYGGSDVFEEQPGEHEAPLNVYGYSKYQFDQYVRRLMPQANSQIVGLRYFNVYGPREQHKGSMASVAFHHHQQIQTEGVVKLFEGCDGYGDGEQRRDFVYVDDVVSVNLWFLEHPEISGIFNVGTGRSQTFNDIANAVIAWHKRGKIHYIPFPDHLRGRYQSFTQADISALRNAGYNRAFKTVEEGVKAYLDAMG